MGSASPNLECFIRCPQKGLLFIFQPHHTACGTLVPGPGMEPAPLPLVTWSLNPWTTRDAPKGASPTHGETVLDYPHPQPASGLTENSANDRDCFEKTRVGHSGESWSHTLLLSAQRGASGSRPDPVSDAFISIRIG